MGVLRPTEEDERGMSVEPQCHYYTCEVKLIGAMLRRGRRRPAGQAQRAWAHRTRTGYERIGQNGTPAAPAQLPERAVSRTIRGEVLERRQPFQHLHLPPSVSWGCLGRCETEGTPILIHQQIAHQDTIKLAQLAECLVLHLRGFTVLDVA